MPILSGCSMPCRPSPRHKGSWVGEAEFTHFVFQSRLSRSTRDPAFDQMSVHVTVTQRCSKRILASVSYRTRI